MIIFLNGSINAGKTTVAKILAKKISNVALVEIDMLRNMIEWMPIDQAVTINLENAVSVIKNFSKNGLNVIVPYPLSQKNHDYVVNELKNVDTKIYFFTLAPKLDKELLFWICFSCISDACTFFIGFLDGRFPNVKLERIEQCHGFKRFLYFEKSL